SGTVHALLVPALFGTRAVLMDRWEPAAARALIAAERVTYMIGAPTFLRDLAAGAPGKATSLRLFSCGGADVDPALVRQAAARLGCVAKRVYGSTEFPTVTTTGPDDPPERPAADSGRGGGAAHGAGPLTPQATRAARGGGGLPAHGEREDRQARAARATAHPGLTAYPRGAC